MCCGGARSARPTAQKPTVRCSPSRNLLHQYRLPLVRAAFPLALPSLSSGSRVSHALAGKMAGNAKNIPPMPGPNFWTMMPATAVISPPKRNRTAYSYHFVCPRTERSTLICIAISARGTRVRKLPQATKGSSRSLQRELSACNASSPN
jgi:hypothetical protein